MRFYIPQLGDIIKLTKDVKLRPSIFKDTTVNWLKDDYIKVFTFDITRSGNHTIVVSNLTQDSSLNLVLSEFNKIEGDVVQSITNSIPIEFYCPYPSVITQKGEEAKFDLYIYEKHAGTITYSPSTQRNKFNITVILNDGESFTKENLASKDAAKSAIVGFIKKYVAQPLSLKNIIKEELGL